MTLKQSNSYLKQVSARKAALRVSAQSSSAIEGIRAPFAKDKKAPADAEAFIALWKRRVAASARYCVRNLRSAAHGRGSLPHGYSRSHQRARNYSRVTRSGSIASRTPAHSESPNDESSCATRQCRLRISLQPGYRSIDHATIESTALTISIVVTGDNNLNPGRSMTMSLGR